MTREQLLRKLDTAWVALKESYDDLPEWQMTAPGIVGDWSIKDILAHVTTWEEEALKYLPLIIEGGKPPKYSVLYGGIDAFNEQTLARKRGLSLTEALKQLDETHARLVYYLQRVPEEQFTRETPFRHRLRLDTYSHYPVHAAMIRVSRRA